MIADLDQDGDEDIACANEGSDNCALFLQGPSGFSAAPSVVLTAAELQEPGGIAVADLDDDGDLDLAVISEGTSALLLFEQLAPGHFTLVPEVVGGSTVMSAPGRLRIEDVDGDGDPDLVLVDAIQGQLFAYFNSH
jgi:hypothetical protein